MPPAERAHDVLRVGHRPLAGFFAPRGVAVIGATEAPGSVGRALLANLLAGGFTGPVHPVNPKRATVLGRPAFPSVKDAPGPVDLAVIAIPAPAVPGAIRECAAAGVRAAVIISAGFRETGPAGMALEREILATARSAGLRLIGPNCLGIMIPGLGLNATFAAAMANPGNVAFLSQSGALCTAVLDWSLKARVGFSAFLSIGSMLDVGWGDLIDEFGNDPATRSIVLYMESVGDARAFLSAAREVALSKPVIVIKAGRTEQAAKAAASHTGTLAGSDDVLDAAFRRSGVVRVDTIEELFSLAEVLGTQPRPRGPRLAVLTNAGGPGVLATDSLIRAGGELAPLAPATVEALNGILPPHWSHGNPVDVLGDADAGRYARALAATAADPHSDGLLVILTPQAMTDATATAAELAKVPATPGKPVLASWMGAGAVADGEAALNAAGIPTFAYPDIAARVFAAMWRYSYSLQGLYETPSFAEDPEAGEAARARVFGLIATARSEGRTLLTEAEAKAVLAAYGLPVTPAEIAPTAAAAVAAAGRLGYPVVLKLHSRTITHKTDVGGVQLNLADAAAVTRAFEAIRAAVTAKAGAAGFEGVTVQPMVKLDGYELILGATCDPQFGPVLLFGAGGQLVEVFQDRALALPPLNTTLARRQMERTRILKALQGVRGRPPVDLEALERLLVTFSRLVSEQPWIKEIDINPLLASPERLVALDARVVLHDPATPEASLPRPAIRPYPIQYVGTWALKDGTPVTIRPIRPEDEPLMIAFHRTLSEQTIHLRYFHALGLTTRIAHERLIRVCYGDFDRELALVVERRDVKTGAAELLCVGRLSRQRGTAEAEFSILVSDAWQHQGLGKELLRRLVDIARQEGIRRITAELLAENAGMQAIAASLGFTVKPSAEPGVLEADLKLW